MDGRLPASPVSRRRCGSSLTLQGGACAGLLGPFWLGRGPSAAPFVDCGVPFLKDWQSGVHTFQQDRECSIATEAFYLKP